VKRRDRALLRPLVPLALMGVIFYLSAQQGVDHSGWLMVVLRKLGHVTEYALLTAAWWWALRGLVGTPLVWAVGISLAYSCTDEFHQTFVHGRDGTPRDVLIDSVGMALAVLLIVRRRKRPVGRAGPDAESVSSRSSLARSP
jgi:VanZ family protein